MAFVVAVAQRKGGSGKTTVAANLATALAEAGLRVALLDADPQATLTRWHALRGEDAPRLALEALSGWRVPAAAERLARDHDAVILDTPPHAEMDSRAAIRAANLVLIPLQPSAPDLWAMEPTLAAAEAERRPVALLLNRLPPARARARRETEAALRGRDLPLLPVALGDRVAFPRAFARGLGAVEEEPTGAAADEARALANAIRNEMS